MLTRRRFLAMGCTALAGSCLPVRSVAAAGRILLPPRSLSFYNTHTKESLDACYWSAGGYDRDALGRIDHILRDHRSGEKTGMDHGLLDLLYSLRKAVCSDEPFHIISGYRSPATNNMLRKRGGGVARGSLHLVGKAADVRLPGCRLEALRKEALALRLGGVGFYPGSGFIHVDTGRVRQWAG